MKFISLIFFKKQTLVRLFLESLKLDLLKPLSDALLLNWITNGAKVIGYKSTLWRVKNIQWGKTKQKNQIDLSFEILAFEIGNKKAN